MAKFRRTAALLACVIAAVSVTGCTDTTYVLKSGDDEVKAGVYIGFMQDELSAQLNMLYNQGVTNDPFSQKVEDKPLADYLKEYALKNTKEYLALKKQFSAEGLKLTDEETKTISTTVNNVWKSNGEYYENAGISKESYKEIYKASFWSRGLFQAYYGKGGKENPSDEDMQKYINDNYIRYKLISIDKSTATDEETKKTETAALEKDRDDFLKKAEGVSFEDFDKLITEYDEFKKAKEEAEKADDSSSTDDSSKADDSSSTDDSSKADDSSATDDSSKADDSSATDDSSKTDDSSATDDSSKTDDSSATDDSSKADDSSSTDDSSKTDDSSATDDSSKTDEKKEEEETDPYKNEIMINLDGYTDEQFSTASGKLYKFVQGMETGKAQAFDNEYCYYIVIKGDVAGRTDYLSGNYDSVLNRMKQKDYEAKIQEWISAADIKLNDKAINRYTPEVIYDRMKEYAEKNQAS